MNRHSNKNNRTGFRWMMIFIGLILIGIAILLINRNSSRTDNMVGSEGNPSDASFTLSVSLPANLASEIVNYEGYTISFNKENHTPNYSAWELTAEETLGQLPRYDKFVRDTDVEGCPDTRDYTRSGYDRGHMAPANDMKWSQEAMEDCFYLTNICPQDHDLNNGAWKTLEGKEKEWAKRDGSLYIIAGPVYTEGDTKRIGSTGVRVPSSFFKIIVSPTDKRGIGFIYPNQYAPGNMKDYSCTIDEVEELTGYNFFPDMSPELEKQIESVTSFKEWDLRKN